MTEIYMGLTSYSELRATLGIVKVLELQDCHIDSTGVSAELEADLLSWVPYSIPELVAAGSTSPWTSRGRQQYLYLMLYSKFFCALSLSSSFEILIQKSISDGQNEMVRQDRDLPAFMRRLADSRDMYKRKFLTVSDQPTQAAAALFNRVSPSYDPVTNETT